MSLKRFMPLLLSLPTVLSAQSEPGPAGAWQVAQVQTPPLPTPPTRRTPLATTNAAATNGPATTNAAATNGPAATPAAANNAQAATPAAATNLPAAHPPMPAIPALPRIAPPPAPTAPARPAASPPTPAPAATIPAPPAESGDVADIVYDFSGGLPVPQLLEIYQSLVKRTLLYTTSGTGAVPKDATVTLKTESPLTHAQAVEALETILGINGITIINIGDKFAKVVTEAGAGSAGDLISTNTNNIPEAGKMITQIVQVKYTDIKDLADVLKQFSKIPNNSIIALPSTETLILRDYAENVARMLDMVHRIDVQSPLLVKPEVINIKYALASDIAQALSALGASGGTSVGKSTTGSSSFGAGRSGFGGNGIGNTGMGGSGSYGGYGGAGNYGAGIGNTGGYSGMGTMTPMALNSPATGARSSFQQNLNKIVQNAASAGQFQLFGQTKIIADERTNSLLVFANDEDMKMIKDIINKLDVVLAQVLIDAIVMEINLTGTRSTGVSYLSQRQGNGYFTGAGGVQNLSSAASSFLSGTTSSVSGGVTNTTAASGNTLANLPGGFSYFSKFGNDLNVVMEAVAGDSRINVLSRPRIQTSHAVPADLFIGNTVPYVTGTYSYYGGGPSSQYTQLEVGIHLQVLPLINPDGLVVMDIQADVEQLGPYVTISGAGQVPTTTKRQAGAKVAVRDGETILLGGFISDSRSTSDSGVPGFKDIPLLGNLFKSKSIQNLRTELVMLMRPTVLTNPAIAAVVARKERNKLSGVKQAELDIRHEEEARNAQIEAELARDAARRAEKAKKDAAKHRGRSTNAPAVTIPPSDE
jgi:general secretion pathway protein D